MCATCFGLYFGRPQASQHTNMYGKIQQISKGPLLVILFYCICYCVGGGRGDWMELAQDRDRWRALVGTVKDFRSHKCGEFLD